MEKVVKCQFCGELYVMDGYSDGKQKCCITCREEAEKNSNKHRTWINKF